MQLNQVKTVFAQLQSKAPRRVVKRAERYVREGKVSQLVLDENGVLKAFVNGSETYRVKVDPVNRVRSCTCPAHKYQRGPCKHVLAAMAPFVN